MQRVEERTRNQIIRPNYGMIVSFLCTLRQYNDPNGKLTHGRGLDEETTRNAANGEPN